MRVAVSLKHIMPVRSSRRELRLAVGLLACVGLGMLHAAEDSEQKTARLGFVFDQQAHDAAIARRHAEQEKHDASAQADDVIHLPKYYVTEERMPFTTREILTPEGRVALANKRYISPVYRKSLGPLSAIASLLMNPLGGWRPNDPEAMALYEDDERLRRKNETKELMRLEALKE
jgi:hypothetical protein